MSDKPMHEVIRDERRTALDAWTKAGGSLRRIKVLTGYAAHARFLATVDDLPNYGFIGTIPMQVEQPYRSSPTHSVLSLNGQPVIVAETKHRRYEVFAVTGPITPLEAEAA